MSSEDGDTFLLRQVSQLPVVIELINVLVTSGAGRCCDCLAVAGWTANGDWHCIHIYTTAETWLFVCLSIDLVCVYVCEANCCAFYVSISCLLMSACSCAHAGDTTLRTRSLPPCVVDAASLVTSLLSSCPSPSFRCLWWFWHGEPLKIAKPATAVLHLHVARGRTRSVQLIWRQADTWQRLARTRQQSARFVGHRKFLQSAKVDWPTIVAWSGLVHGLVDAEAGQQQQQQQEIRMTINDFALSVASLWHAAAGTTRWRYTACNSTASGNQTIVSRRTGWCIVALNWAIPLRRSPYQ